jgi:hypothetical protein
MAVSLLQNVLSGQTNLSTQAFSVMILDLVPDSDDKSKIIEASPP